MAKSKRFISRDPATGRFGSGKSSVSEPAPQSGKQPSSGKQRTAPYAETLATNKRIRERNATAMRLFKDV